jgi:hypothetical protein
MGARHDDADGLRAKHDDAVGLSSEACLSRIMLGLYVDV